MASKFYKDATRPSSTTFEELLDDRSIYIDPFRVYRFRPMNTNSQRTDQYKDTVLRGIYPKDLLNQLYFSSKNIDNLDAQLRYAVYLMSRKQYVLGPQNKQELVVIMRSVFLRYCQNIPGSNITEQIRRLNNIVVSEAAPDLLSYTTQYLKYLEDANESHKVLIARPVNVNNAGLKLLRTGDVIGV